MKTILKTGTVDIPDKVKVTIVSRIVTVTGPRGKVVKNLKHLPVEMVFKDEKTIKIDRWFTYGKQAACIRTACSHINNMILGVTVGFEYKMRFVYAHFPINCTITGQKNKVEIRNFLGEKVVRTVDCYEGVTASRSTDIKDEIVLVGNDIENVSKTWCAAPYLVALSSYAALRGGAPCSCARGRPWPLELCRYHHAPCATPCHSACARRACGREPPFPHVSLPFVPSTEPCSLVYRSALIQQICAVKHKDIRKFLDGIYVSAKGNVVKD